MQDAKAGRSSGISVDDDEDQDMGEEVPGTSGKGKHTFAPRDTKLMVYEQKEEKAGLGYVRGMGKGLERAKPLSESSR
jgi:G patch domain-containing protein 1